MMTAGFARWQFCARKATFVLEMAASTNALPVGSAASLGWTAVPVRESAPLGTCVERALWILWELPVGEATDFAPQDPSNLPSSSRDIAPLEALPARELGRHRVALVGSAWLAILLRVLLGASGRTHESPTPIAKAHVLPAIFARRTVPGPMRSHVAVCTNFALQDRRHRSQSPKGITQSAAGRG